MSMKYNILLLYLLSIGAWSDKVVKLEGKKRYSDWNLVGAISLSNLKTLYVIKLTKMINKTAIPKWHIIMSPFLDSQVQEEPLSVAGATTRLKMCPNTA